MTKITYLAIFCALLAIAAARPCFAQGLTIDQFGAAGALSDSDLIGIEQGGTPPALKTTLGALRAYMTAVQTPAFYVATPASSPAGNDSNPGTLAAPFATLGKAQTAMTAAGNTIKTTYVRAGTYNMTTIGAGCDGGPSQAMHFTNTDAGETWSYYPPDGVNTAIIDGGASAPFTGVNVGFCVDGGVTSKITFNGLQMQHFAACMIVSYSPIMVTNGVFHDTYNTNTGGGALHINDGSAGTSFTHNYVYNMATLGFFSSGNLAGGTNNLTVSNNYFYNTCTGAADCGAIYMEDLAWATTLSTGSVIKDNYIRDVFISGGGQFYGGNGIYMDYDSSNVTMTGNVVTGTVSVCFYLTNGGMNNKATHNICDMPNGSRKGYIVVNSGEVGGYPNTAETGNVFSNNMVVNNFPTTAPTGYGGYSGPASPLVGATVTNNGYFNYGNGGAVAFNCGNPNTCIPNAAQDANPTSVDPQITCWNVTIAGGSPIFSAPISFPALTTGWGTAGFWGPPGFTIPQVGTAPSWVHNC